MNNIRIKGLLNANGLVTETTSRQPKSSPKYYTTEQRTTQLRSFIKEFYDLKLEQAVTSPSDRQTTGTNNTGRYQSILSKAKPATPISGSGRMSPQKRVRIAVKTSQGQRSPIILEG